MIRGMGLLPMRTAVIAAIPMMLACDDEVRGGPGGLFPAQGSAGSASASGVGSAGGEGGGGDAGGAGGGSGGEGWSGPACAAPDRRCEVEVRYPFDGELSVELRGNFTPEGWASGVPMQKTDAGWSATIKVPWDVDVQYKFVINGSSWKEDPNNPSKINDGYGGWNSILESASCVAHACAPAPLVRFAVLGDFGTAAYGGGYVLSEAAVAVLIASWSPDFIVTLGDNNYPNGVYATIDMNIGQFYHSFIHPYKGGYGKGASENRFFPCLGNHDWNTGSVEAYTDYFELPGNERYWDIARGPVRIFCVDSEPQEPDGTTPGSVQGQWLKQALGAATEPFKIVIMHRPPYSSGPHASTPWMQWPFGEWGATAVMAGHDHIYERLLVGGVPYFVNGLGGAQPYGFNAALVAGSVTRFAGGFGAMLVEVPAGGGAMITKAITTSGTLLDHYAISAP